MFEIMFGQFQKQTKIPLIKKKILKFVSKFMQTFYWVRNWELFQITNNLEKKIKDFKFFYGLNCFLVEMIILWFMFFNSSTKSNQSGKTYHHCPESSRLSET